jgi:hypothetical protein
LVAWQPKIYIYIYHAIGSRAIASRHSRLLALKPVAADRPGLR